MRLLPLLLIALIAEWLPAQSLPAELRARSVQLLDSSSLSDKAWGAHLVAGLRFTDLQDRLITELRACRHLNDAPVDGPEYAYVQQLLDALIQLDVSVPVDLILPFRRGYRAEVMILLLRQSAGEDVLFEMLDRAVDDTEWLAIANTLVHMRSARILERLLDGLPVTHSFFVSDGVFSYTFEAGSLMGYGTVFGTRRLAQGFPPAGVYRLSRFASLSSVLLAPGPTNVYYRRTVVSADATGWGDGGPDAVYTKRVDHRIHLIAARSGYSQDLVSQLFRPRSEILWRSPASLTREATRKLDAQVSAIRGFIRHVWHFELTPLKSFRLEIQPEVHDLRNRKTPALPVPAPRIVEMERP